MRTKYEIKVQGFAITKSLFDTLYHLGGLQKHVSKEGHITGSGYLSVLKSLGLANGKTQLSRIPTQLASEVEAVITILDDDESDLDFLINYVPIEKGKFVYEENYR